tara:strand:- start:110 stop:475 length:366 start_codon:yes stop_codon:yes gene_type:complete
MTFDSHSLNRLKELGRKLPKEISKPKTLETNILKRTKKQKLHPVEIEDNPEKLFRELMEISPDGNIPLHLINRLKELESNIINNDINEEHDNNDYSEENTSNISQNLYTQFKQLLLEDEVN